MLSEIKVSGRPFISPGDGSNAIHSRELRLWGPDGPPKEASWYVETRAPMDRTLMTASERSGYVLCDVATFLRLRADTRLAIVLSGDPALRISYRVTLPGTGDARDGSQAAGRLRDWLLSERCRSLLKTFRIDGERPFYARAEGVASGLRGRLDPEPVDELDEDR